MLLHCTAGGLSFSQEAGYNITYRLLTQEDGLAGRVALCGLQDSRGFVWVGTKDGLDRYDGYKFQLLTKEKNSLQSNHVAELYEDQHQKLWVLYGYNHTNTLAGGKVDILDISTQKVVPFDKYFGTAAPLKQEQIAAIAGNRLNEVYIYSNDGFVYLYTGNKFTKLNANNRIKEDAPHYFSVNNGTMNGLWLRYDYFVGKDGKVTTVPEHDNGYLAMYYKGTDSMIVMELAADKKLKFGEQRMYSVSPSGLHAYKPPFGENDSRTFYDICKKDFYFITRDHKTGHTVIEREGTDLYVMRNEQLLHLLNIKDIKGIASLSVTDVFSDREGKLWICTNAGLFVFKVAVNRFSHYLNSTKYKLEGQHPNYQVRGINTDTAGNVYISGTTGAYKIRETDPIKGITVLNTDPYCTPMAKQGPFYYYGRSELYEYNSNTGRERALFGKDSQFIWSIHKLAADRWWISVPDRPYLVTNGQYRPIYDEQGQPITGNCWIHQFFTDKMGQRWMAGTHGLYLMKNDSTVAQHWSTTASNAKYRIPIGDIHYVHVDGSGDFWLATNGAGLYKWETSKGKFRHFTIADGLSSNTLYAILEDQKGYLWISSGYGLMQFNKKTFSVKTYTAKDGLTDNEFNRLSYHKADNGRMYFGGIDGVNAFDPRNFWQDGKRFTAPMQITAFRKFAASTARLEDKTEELINTHKILLQPGDNFFSLDFALLDFEEGRRRYAYKIEGLDDKWQYLDVNSISLSRLPYGKYTLMIRGQNNEGEWSTQELSLPLEVLMPLYKQPWFVIGCAVLALLALLGFMRLRLWQYRKRNAQLEQTVAVRTGELKTSLIQKEVLLKEIHHRVKNNLQVISSLLQLQSRSLTDATAREALMESQNRVLSIALVHQKLYQNERLDAVDFAGFTDELFAQIHAVFSTDKKVNFVNQLPKMMIEVDVAVPLGLIMNELITNSFKYAFHRNPQPEILVKMQQDNADYLWQYQDNGPGLPAELEIAKSPSLGLRLITRLAKQLGGSVHYDNGTFSIRIPADVMTAATVVNNSLTMN
jgi:two-component sensor histidine kinase/streptogramin lyase